MIENKIWLSSPHMGLNELKNVTEAFETNWISSVGPFIESFEKKLASHLNVEHVAALNSGTSAIHLALILLNVKKDDIVFCQSFTFSASANPILYLGALPVFIDSESDTWNMCPNALEEAILRYIKIGKKPKAIIPVHLYGMPAKMNEIISIAAKYEIPIIEDAAEAVGSKYNNMPCGSIGELGVLSFNGNKIITTSSGGALLSKNEKMIESARFLATQARDTAIHYQHSQVGYNYRLSNVLAAIGMGQLDVLEDRVIARRENFEYYVQALSGIEEISFLFEMNGFFCNRWLTCILVNPINKNGIDNEKIQLALKRENIESRPLWKPMHLQPLFKDADFIGGKVSEDLFKVGLCLPSGSNLTINDLNRVTNAIISLFV